jgi:hypothetical protein
MRHRSGVSAAPRKDARLTLRLAGATVDLFGHELSIIEMKAAGLLLLAALAAVAAAGDLLVRVDLSSDADIEIAAATGGGFLQRFDGWFLVRVRTKELTALSGRLGCRVLDTDVEGKRYVYAVTEPGFDRRRLARCGTVLTEDREGALLCVTAEGLRRLTTLPVELCGVSIEPLRSSHAPRPPSLTPSSVSDSLIWQLMARASQDSAEAVLRRLIAFRTRYAITDSCWAASNWFQQKLVAYGCDSTYLDTFLMPLDSRTVNVVGVKRGRLNPNRIHIICGHIDNTSETPETFAPGSDDNASGAGLVIEAARMFQGVEFDYTVWFVGFGAEEFGLVGSDTFARECGERGDTIVLAINHDMNSYGTAGRDSIRVVGKRASPPCSSWVEYYMAMADTFTDLECLREIVDDQASSDQHSFWKYGYPAIRDRYLDRDPVYHTTGDTIGPYQYCACGTNNIPMYTEAIKATVATMAKLAGARPETAGVAESRPLRLKPTMRIMPSVGRAPVLVRLSSTVSPVSVYNAAGMLIRTLGAGRSHPLPLLRHHAPAGGPAQIWDGRDFSGTRASPGVYYFRAAESSVRFVLAE